MKRIVVLVSGNGSNLQAVMNHSQTQSYTVSAVFSDKAHAYGLTRAKQENIATHALNPHDFATRAAFDHELMTQINRYQPDLIVLAGYMRILSTDFVNEFSGKLLNIHPSLLPKYPGLHTHQRALEAKDHEHGTSVHFVTPELDGGPVILQAKIPIFAEDTVETLNERIQTQEHQIYPLVIKWFVDGRLTLSEQGKAVLDDMPLPAHGYAYE